MMKKSKKDKQRLLLSTEKVRELRPVSDQELKQVGGGMRCQCCDTTACQNGSWPTF